MDDTPHQPLDGVCCLVTGVLIAKHGPASILLYKLWRSSLF
jgi:hypothetical protein